MNKKRKGSDKGDNSPQNRASKPRLETLRCGHGQQYFKVFVRGFIPVFLNRRAAARYRALTSIIPGREMPEETTICYKVSLVRLITYLNVILY